jgi:hypothetical protein
VWQRCFGMPVCTRNMRTARGTSSLWLCDGGAGPFQLVAHLGGVVEQLLHFLSEREWGALAVVSPCVGGVISNLIHLQGTPAWSHGAVRTDAMQIKCRRVATLRRLQRFASRRGLAFRDYWGLMRQVQSVIRPHEFMRPAIRPCSEVVLYGYGDRHVPDCAFADALTAPTPTGRAMQIIDLCYWHWRLSPCDASSVSRLHGPWIHRVILLLTRCVWGDDPRAHERVLRCSAESLRSVLDLWLRGLSRHKVRWCWCRVGEYRLCYRYTLVPVPLFVRGVLGLLDRQLPVGRSLSGTQVARLFHPRVRSALLPTSPTDDARVRYRQVFRRVVLRENPLLRARHAAWVSSSEEVRSGHLYAMWVMTQWQLDREIVFGLHPGLRAFENDYYGDAMLTNANHVWTFTVGEVKMRQRDRRYRIRDNNRAYPLDIVPDRLIAAVQIGVRQRHLKLRSGMVILGAACTDQCVTRSICRLQTAAITDRRPAVCTCAPPGSATSSVQGQSGSCPCAQCQERCGRRDAACIWDATTQLVFASSKAQIVHAFRLGRFANAAGLAEWDGDGPGLHVSEAVRILSRIVARGGTPPFCGYPMPSVGLYQIVVLEVALARDVHMHGLCRCSERQMRVLEAYVSWVDAMCVGLFVPTNAPPAFWKEEFIRNLEQSPYACSKVYRLDQVLFLRRVL